MTTVIREVIPTIEESLGEPIFDFGDPFTDDALAPTNSLLQGVTSRTSTTNGRSATVAAGEDIRPALASLKSAGGGTLILLAGTHKIDYTIEGFAKLVIQGQGREQTILECSGSGGITYIGTSSAHITYFGIADLTIRDVIGFGIEIDYADYWNVRNVVVDGTTAACISVNHSTIFEIHDSVFKNSGSRGVYIITSGTSTTGLFTLNNLLCTGNTLDGIYIKSFSGTYSVSFFKLVGCVSIGNGQNGITLTSSSANRVQQGQIIGCIFSENTAIGCHLDTNIIFISVISTICGLNTGDNMKIEAKYTTVSSPILAESVSGYDLNVTSNAANISIVGSQIYVQTSSPNSRIFISPNTDTTIDVINQTTPVTRQVTMQMKNTSGATINAGNVVILKSVAAADEITTTTTAGDNKVFGVALAAISNNAYGAILIEGKTTLLTVNGTTDIAIGDYLTTYTSAGIAQKATAGQTAFAIALEAYTTNDSNGVIDALLISPRII